jgi:hypothetical protein
MAGTHLRPGYAKNRFHLFPGVRIKTVAPEGSLCPPADVFALVEIAVWLHVKYPTNPAENKFERVRRIIASIDPVAWRRCPKRFGVGMSTVSGCRKKASGLVLLYDEADRRRHISANRGFPLHQPKPPSWIAVVSVI